MCCGITASISPTTADMEQPIPNKYVFIYFISPIYVEGSPNFEMVDSLLLLFFI